MSIHRYLSSLLLAAIMPLIANSQNDWEKYGCLTQPVQYEYFGETTNGILLFVSYTDSEIPLQYSDMYLLSEMGSNIKLSNETTQFTGVYNVAVSDDSKYLAVFFVAEGHPWIEVYDLEKILYEAEFIVLAELNPYPGVFHLVAWEGHKLLIESDIDLLPLNTQEEYLSFENIFDDYRNYVFDMKTLKYQERD